MGLTKKELDYGQKCLKIWQSITSLPMVAHHILFAKAIEAAARQKALEEAAEVCAEISKDYWMGDAQFEAATRCRNAILAMGKEGGQHGAE